MLRALPALDQMFAFDEAGGGKVLIDRRAWQERVGFVQQAGDSNAHEGLFRGLAVSQGGGLLSNELEELGEERDYFRMLGRGRNVSERLDSIALAQTPGGRLPALGVRGDVRVIFPLGGSG